MSVCESVGVGVGVCVTVFERRLTLSDWLGSKPQMYLAATFVAHLSANCVGLANMRQITQTHCF